MGRNASFESGMVETCSVLSATILATLTSLPAVSLNTMELPSGVQLGRAALNSTAERGRRVPPSAETTRRRDLVSALKPENAICLPSGDQRGKLARSGVEVNCSFWLPSLWLRHSVPSGKAT